MNPLEWILIAVIIFINGFFLIATIGSLVGASFGAPFIPSGRRTVRRMIEAAEIRPDDVVFDLGCGDGRLVFAAENAGAKKSIGVEISPPVWLIAQIRRVLSRSQKSEIRLGNIFKQKDIEEADIIFCFLMRSMMDKVMDQILPRMKPGAKIISHAFTPHEGKPDLVIPATRKHGKIAIFVKQ